MYGGVKKGSREFSLARTSKDNPMMCIPLDTASESCKAKKNKKNVHFMCYKYTLKLMKNGTKMVCLDMMSRHDREKQRYFCVWTNCPNVRAKKIICVWT